MLRDQLSTVKKRTLTKLKWKKKCFTEKSTFYSPRLIENWITKFMLHMPFKEQLSFLKDHLYYDPHDDNDW
jgi:hypothetical protein